MPRDHAGLSEERRHTSWQIKWLIVGMIFLAAFLACGAIAMRARISEDIGDVLAELLKSLLGGVGGN